MGVDLCVYRLRIGSFLPLAQKCCCRKSKLNQFRTEKIPPTDVKTRQFLCSVLTISLIIATTLYILNNECLLQHAAYGKSAEILDNRLQSCDLYARRGTDTHPVQTEPMYLSLIDIADIVQQLLMQASDVEANPGPTQATNKTRGGARQKVSQTSSRQQDQDVSFSQAQLRELRSRSCDVQPSSISTWLRVESDPDESLMNDAAGKSVTDADDEIDTFDSKRLLLDIHREVKSMNKKFDSVEKSIEYLKSENVELKAQNESLKSELSAISQKVITMESTMTKCSIKQEKLELQNKRCNLKFFNLNQTPDETSTDTEELVRSFITQDLGLEASSVNIDRAFRLPSKTKPHPILAQFNSVKQRDNVISAFRSKRKSGVLTARVGEDLPERVSRCRAGLYPLLRESLEQKKTAYFKYDTLLVNGEKYIYDDNKKAPVLVTNTSPNTHDHNADEQAAGSPHAAAK